MISTLIAARIGRVVIDLPCSVRFSRYPVFQKELRYALL